MFLFLEINVPRVSDSTGQPVADVDKREKSQSRIDVIRDIDLVPSNVQPVHHEALLYVFEDNEAVIKMIIKGRSPTMRHVSRTHRVALDWLFDRINLDPKIQIKYIETKNQLADILTKGSFTRDEWNHLLTLFNISHFSSTTSLATMAKRAQQNSEKGRVTAKSRPMMNLTARTPSIMSSSASTNPGGGCNMDIMNLNNVFLTIAQGNLLHSQDQIMFRNMVHLSLLKCGHAEMENMKDQGNLNPGIHWKSIPFVENIFSAEPRTLQGTKKLFTIERGNPCQRMSRIGRILKSSSREVT